MEFLRFFLIQIQYLEDENIISNDYSSFFNKGYMKLRFFIYTMWFFFLLKRFLTLGKAVMEVLQIV